VSTAVNQQLPPAITVEMIPALREGIQAPGTPAEAIRRDSAMSWDPRSCPDADSPMDLARTSGGPFVAWERDPGVTLPRAEALTRC
jgi:hypothetical protein